MWSSYRWSAVDLDGGRGLVLEKDGATTAAVSFGYDQDGRAANIFIVRNPDKLGRLGRAGGRGGRE